GVAGEIYIGGAGVARGYLNRPELTAERFVPLRIGTLGLRIEEQAATRSASQAGESAIPESQSAIRIYKTGDLGRYLPDGNIEFLGRNDHQVKIRGFRIELGEIEARLEQQPGIREAVVLAREDVPGEKRLVAYVISEQPELDATRLRQALTVSLPEYMLPAAYVRLEALPLTPNGKLDVRALPAPESAAFGQRQYEEPQGAIESALAQIWSELLQVERVGRQDHFFGLGGHSLLTVQLMERMRREGLDVDVRALFVTPTLAELAAAAEDME